MKKIDLTEITFMIPFRCDSQDRIDNLMIVVEYLTHHFITTIMIKEDAQTSVLEHYSPLQEIGRTYNSNGRFFYSFNQNDSEVFHRTKILNDMLEGVDTLYVANYDTDVLFPVQSYIDTLKALNNGEVFVFPYLGKFYEIPRKHIPEIRNRMEVNWIDLSQCGVNHPQSVGGAMFFNTEVYKKLGGENESYMDWGGEDNFRVLLFQKMGYNIKRVGSDLYHLAHFRGKSSSPSNPYFNENMNKFYRSIDMSKEELLKHIATYNRFS